MANIRECDFCEQPIVGDSFTRENMGECICKFCKEHEPCDEENGGCGSLMKLGDVIFTGNASKGEGNYVWGTCVDCGREAKVYDF